MGAITRGNADLPVLLATNLNGYFGQLVLDYQHQIYTFALRQTGSSEQAGEGGSINEQLVALHDSDWRVRVQPCMVARRQLHCIGR